MVAVLYQLSSGRRPSGAEIDGNHAFHTGFSAPRRRTRLSRTRWSPMTAMPGRAGGAGLLRPHAILPNITGHEIAARVANYRYPEVVAPFDYVERKPDSSE